MGIVLVTSQQQGFAALIPGLAPILHYSIVLVPVLISFLLSLASRFNAGKKWVTFRGNAELIKSELFFYRSQTKIYHESEGAWQDKLMQKVNAIREQLLDTEIMNTSLFEKSKQNNSRHAQTGYDRLSILSAEQYLAVRLEDQLTFY